MKRWQAILLFLSLLTSILDLLIHLPTPALAIRGMTVNGKDINFVYARGAPSGTSKFDGAYPAGFINNAIQPPPTMPTAEFVANAIYLFPFTTNHVATMDDFEVQMGAFGTSGTLCKLAIYDSRSDTDLYPKNRLFQSPADNPVDGTTAGPVTDGCASGAALPCTIEEPTVGGLQLLPDRLYWFALWCNGQPGPKYLPLAATWEFPGIDINLTEFGNAYRVPTTYAANFPNPFPAGSTGPCTILNCAPRALDKLPMVMAHFSS